MPFYMNCTEIALNMRGNTKGCLVNCDCLDMWICRFGQRIIYGDMSD